ncbi:hypothetical protein LZ32DRAFT_615767 [Colletotrichum eremochloae]|nr:hypothetical protein LZ32DRAFT_615767 [Colletotrichum eremochloae]
MSGSDVSIQEEKHSLGKVRASWLNQKVTPFLQFLPRLTSVHPIPVVALVTLLASTAYIVLFEDILSGDACGVAAASKETGWSSLLVGSRSLWASPESNWTWHGDNPETSSAIDHHALFTLVFSGPASANVVPVSEIEDKFASVMVYPSSPVLFSMDDQDKTLSFYAPYPQAPRLLAALREIPSRDDVIIDDKTTETGKNAPRDRIWITKTSEARILDTSSRTSRTSIMKWIRNAYSESLALLKTTEALDIVFMALGYISMNLTLASLVLSMRRLGSKLSLTTIVLVSSSFALIFGLLVTTKLFHTPITMRLLLEGLPFFVVLVGFEKSILLTQSVLSHAIEHKQSKGPSNMAKYAVETAKKDTGLKIVQDYALKILMMTLGAFSGIQGGLQEFCFLAAWILCFDCVLLFLFYIPVLCIKVEINRIQRQINIRNSLEDDGISHRVAERVARDSDPGTLTIFGRQMSNIRNIHKLKVLAVGCFGLVSLVNLVYMIFVGGTVSLLANSPTQSLGWGRNSSTQPLVDPFKIAPDVPDVLDHLLRSAKLKGHNVVVTVLRPIEYELASTSYSNDPSGSSHGGNLDAMGVGAESILKSLEDPMLQKWIIGALTLSVAFNIYLFNAARWGIKDDHAADYPNLTDSKAIAQPEREGGENAPLPAFTPAEIKDESQPPIRPTAPNPAGIDAIRMHRSNLTHELTDDEIASLSLEGLIPGYALEKTLNFDFVRAVRVRRNIVSRTKVAANLTYLLEQSKLPYSDYDWSRVFGACCENVIGYMPIPLGVAGPLTIDGKSYFIPMATTEGVLVASVSRGAKAINAGGGAITVLTSDGMTRGPCVGFKSLERAGLAKAWLDSEEGWATMKNAFDSTSRFARLEGMTSVLAGTKLYIRFKASTADAMGMNMISKGVEKALDVMRDTAFDDMIIVTLTGNYCIDKKASAMNWIQGRGKSVVAEATIPGDVIKAVLKTDIDSLVDVFVNKNMIGSAMAGSIGGFNAQAANIVAAIFIATGQDPAQVVESSNCITIMERVGQSLHITVSMPSIEVGTLGGGTILGPQSAVLDFLGVRGPHPTQPGANARRLARIIAAATLAGELSLCSALAAGHLVRAHMQHNRSAAPTRSNTPAPDVTLSTRG